MAAEDIEPVAKPPSNCLGCGGPLPPSKTRPRKYCSPPCREVARNPPKPGYSRRRRPLPDFAKDAGWSLRKDIDRFERIFADDRFPDYKQQVAASVRGHLEYAAQVCQDLISRLDHPTGG